jgi:transketolase
MPSPRDYYGQTLLKLAKENHQIVALEADLSKATRSMYIRDNLPERFIELGIAEQNMMGTACGLALSGKVPFVHSFATFLTGRAYDQVRVCVALANANVKLIGAFAGLSDYGDGATHQSIEDISLMRTLPNMTVIVPADAVEAEKATEAIANYNGPVYFRMTRNDDIPTVTSENTKFEIGKIYPLKEGTDILYFACGVMVGEALKAADLLQRKGISAGVVNVSTIKPLDVKTIKELAHQTPVICTVEEHSVIGGLGSAICETLSEEIGIRIKRLGIGDGFGQTGPSHESLLKLYKLTSEDIADAARKFLA